MKKRKTKHHSDRQQGKPDLFIAPTLKTSFALLLVFSFVLFALATAPTHDTPVLNSSDGTARITSNLTAYNQTGADVDGQPINFKKTFYKNGVLNQTNIYTNGLLLWLPLKDGDGATSFIDYSGNRNNGSCTNCPTWNATAITDGLYTRGAYMFDMSEDDLINFSNSSTWVRGNVSQSYVIEIQLHNNLTADSYIFAQFDGTNGDISIQIDSPTQRIVSVKGSSTQSTAIGTELYDFQKHFVVVDYNTTHFKYYMDGVLTDTRVAGGGNFGEPKERRIGKRLGGGSNTPNMTLSVFGIYNRSLSASEVALLYEGSRYDGEILPSSNLKRADSWLVEMTPYTYNESGTPLNSSALIIQSTPPTLSGVTINASLGLNRTNENLTGFNQSATDIDGDNIVHNYAFYKNGVLNATRWINDSSCILYLPFDGNSTQDYCRGNDGTAMNGANGTPEGKVRDGYIFNGVNSYVSVADSDDLSPSISINFSSCAWVYPNYAESSNKIIMSKGLSSGNNWEWEMRQISNNRIDAIIFTASGNTLWNTATTTGSLKIQKWNHVCFVANLNNSLTLYFNGVADGIDTIQDNSQGSSNGNSPLRIGYRNTNQFPFNGSIDEVMIYNRSLSPSEIQQIYQATRDGFATLDSDQTLKGENWSISMTPYDQDITGIALYSNNITIRNTPPTQSNITYPTTNLTGNSVVNWSQSTDDDGDTIYYLLFQNSTNSFTRLLNTTGLNGNTSLSSSGSYSLFVNATDLTDITEGALFNFIATLPISTPAQGGGTLGRCDALAQAYSTCYYYQSIAVGCVKGCPTGFSCNKNELRCVEGGNTTSLGLTFNAPTQDAPIFKLWAKFKSLVGGFFDVSPTLTEAMPLQISTPTNSGEAASSSTYNIDDGAPIDKVISNPIMALVIVGLIGMALGLLQFGILPFVPPHVFFLITYWLIVALMWKFKVFGEG